MTYKTVKDIICCMDKTARERGVKWMDSTMLLYALRWPESEAGRILRYGGFEKVEDAYCLMERFDNEPLAEGGEPEYTPTMVKIMANDGSPLELLRAIQHTDCEASRILHERGLLPPEREPSDGQVERAAETGYFLSARSYFSYGNLKAWDKVKQTSKEKWREWARLMLEATLNGVGIDYQYDGAHDARPTEHTLHGLDGLDLSCLDWMRLSHVCRLMSARNRKPKQAFVRVSGWTADRPNMRLIMDVLQNDDGTVSVPLPLTSDYLLVDSDECDDRFQYGWLDVLERLPEHVDYGRLDETGMRVVDWLDGMADPSPEIFEDWEAISLIRQNFYEDEPTGLADLLRSATRTERDECFDMLEQVETGRPL